ncbi:hypothetical protein ABC347_10255 [Sphingomonas sp. 1P06PA]|uniref:hypothetical protein n=1 Tax=Sphingomonas sp. 1P06PA TaxID=554121 RepID=UPI0039A6F4D8
MTASSLSAALRLKIADELELAREEIERLGAILCSDARLVTAHMVALQALDMLGQQQLALAKILRSDDPRAAIANTPLETLRSRLERSLD